jgi:multidrug efflux pump subunit AcrA (membrane-fusion protein)
MKKVIFRLVLVLVILGAAYGGYRYFDRMPQKQLPVATAKVRRGDVIVRAYSRGELQAVRSAKLLAPNLLSTVQVTKLAPLGAFAHEKDLIVEFDDSERRTALEEALLEVEQIDEQIKKAQADLAIRTNQDQVELLKARYSVRRGELEVKRNELISPIDAKKNELNLEEARRRLLQLESDIKSRQIQSEADLAVLREKRARSMLDVGRERTRIAQSKLLSPITGLVAIKQNRGGFQGSFGQQVPDIREGDTLQPGTPVAEVLDLSEMEIIAKVGELDRANLHEGQDVKFQLDALPDKTLHGKIKGMSGTATADPFNGDPAKKFDVIFSVDMKELMTVLGATPEQIREVEATAARNAKNAPTSSVAARLSALEAASASAAAGARGGPAGMPGMPGADGAAGDEGGGAQGGGGRGGRGGGGGRTRGEGGGGRGAEGGRGGGGDRMARMMEQLPDAVKKDIQKELKGKKIEDLAPEDRAKIMARMREAGGFGGGRGGGGRGEGGFGGRGGGGGRGGPNDTSEADRENAKLPPPPEENSQLATMLRPGMLADVEITVEKIPDAISVPNQAVFEKGGRTIVYVENTTTHRFDERPVKLAKRSESVMVISDGLQPGETIALGDPTSKKNDKAAEAPKSMGAMPGAGVVSKGK